MQARTRTLLLTAVLAAACASPSPERAAVEAMADAIGGRDRVLSLTALTLEGSGAAPNLGQNRLPDDDLPVWHIREYRRVVDLATGRTQVRQLREAGFLFAGATTQRQVQGLDGDIAYNVTAEGAATRASGDAARTRRMELLHHPVTALRAAMARESQLANLRTEASERLVDVQTAAGDSFTLAADTTTGLPSRVVSQDAHPNLGDVTLVTAFSDYGDVDGLRLPRRLITKIDSYEQLDLRISRQTLEGDAADLAAPAAVRAAPLPPSPRVEVTVEPVAPGIWWLAGSGNHRSVVFEFDDHLMLFEAPASEARTKAVIDTARTLSPKPLTIAVVSHHHFDHSGGLRVAVAEGLTILTHAANGALFRQLLARSHTRVPDALQRSPREATFAFVNDSMVLKDRSMEVQLYHLLDNPREGTNLYAYVPRDGLLVQADLYDAGWQQHPWGANVLENLNRRKLRVIRSVPVHGVIEPFEQVVKAIQARPAAPPVAQSASR